MLSLKGFSQDPYPVLGSGHVSVIVEEQAYIGKDPPRHEGWVLLLSFAGHHVPITDASQRQEELKQRK